MPNYINRYLMLNIWPENSLEAISFGVDWKITFRIKKCASSDFLSFNMAEISVYNMSSELREKLSSKNLLIELNAGYDSMHNVVFSGRVNNVTTVKQTTELITTFYCVSDTRSYTDLVNICVQNVSVTDLIAQLCDKHGVSYRLPFKRTDVVKKSYTGPFSKVIALICHEYGISCAMDNGQLLFRDRKATEETLDNAIIKVYTPNSGMIGNPTVTEVGVRFKALLQSDLKINDYFRLYAPYADYNLNSLDTRPNAVVGNELNAMAHIDTRTYNGAYMVLNLTMNGDTRGNAWYTDVEGSRIWPKQYNAR